jgi:hypothetical protein
MYNGKWCYSTDEEIFNSDDYFHTKEEAIVAGEEYAKGCEYEQYYVGQITSIVPKIDTTGLLERIGEDIYEDCGEVAENYLCDVTKEQEKELDEWLNSVFITWLYKHNLHPNFYNIKNVSSHSVDD